MAKALSNEFKTGLVLVAAVGLLVGVLYQTGDLAFSKNQYTAKAYFGFTGGVKKFAPVRLSGVEVGEVKDVRILYEPEMTRVEIILGLDSGAKLRKDSVASVVSLGMMGEKYIEISPGVSPEFIAQGETIMAQDPLGFDELMERANDIADSVELTLADFRDLVNHADIILVDNKPKIDSMFDNLEETSIYFKDFSEDIKYHPWKVLMKGREKTPEEIKLLRAKRKALREEEKEKEGSAEEVESVQSTAQDNFITQETEKKDKKRRFDSRQRR